VASCKQDEYACPRPRHTRHALLLVILLLLVFMPVVVVAADTGELMRLEPPPAQLAASRQGVGEEQASQRIAQCRFLPAANAGRTHSDVATTNTTTAAAATSALLPPLLIPHRRCLVSNAHGAQVAAGRHHDEEVCASGISRTAGSGSLMPP
jgi:hypothetical protein